MKKILVLFLVLICSSCGLVYDTYDFFNEKYFNDLQGTIEFKKIDLKNIPKEWDLGELNGKLTFDRCTTNTKHSLTRRKNIALACPGTLEVGKFKIPLFFDRSGNKDLKSLIKIVLFIDQVTYVEKEKINNIFSGEYEIVLKTDKELTLKKIRNIDKQFPDFLITINGTYQTK